MMMLVANALTTLANALTTLVNTLTTLAIATIATRLAKMMYVQFYFRFDKRLLISSAEIKLIAVYDSDPDFIEYVKPKAKAKVSVFSNVYVYEGADT